MAEVPRFSVGKGALVVGGGFLGAHVAAALTAVDVPTTVLTRRIPPPGPIAARLAPTRLVVGDAVDPEVLDDALVGCGHVVWCAGGRLPAESTTDSLADLLSSLPAFLTGLEALRRRPGVALTLFSSGGTVYGEPQILPVPEVHPLMPGTSYAVMKTAAEHYLAVYRRLHGVHGLVLRCGNVYGGGQLGDRSQGLVAAALTRVLAGERISVYGDGSNVRDFVHIDDVVQVVLALLGRRDIPTTLNVGSGTGTSITDLLEMVEEVTGLPVRLDRRPPRPDDVHRVVLDIALLRSVMRFEPLPLRDGLARTWSEMTEAALARQ